MKFGVIGTGWITEAFIEGALLYGCMEPGAVYSRELGRAREFARKYGCDNAFDSLEAMADFDGIEAVYIASPNALHYRQSKLFLEHGKHVICEKPSAVTAEKYCELAALADSKGLVYLEAIMFMHHPQRETIKKALAETGNITTARLDFSQLSSKYSLLVEGKNPNIFNPALGAGCLMDMGVYCLYPALEWFGEPAEVSARAGFVSTGADGFVNSIFSYPDKQVDITLSKTGQSLIGSEVLGDKATLKIGFIVLMTDVWLATKGGKPEKVIEDNSRAEVMGAEANDFCRYIREYAKHEAEYRHNRDITLKVMQKLDLIRSLVGIDIRDA